MESLKYHTITGIPVIQNKQDFVIGVFSIRKIFRFTRYTSRLIVSFDENEQPIYNEQIQREVEGPRVQKIADFLINDPDATFPTNIVLHIPREAIEKQDEKNSNEQNKFVEIFIREKVFEDLRNNRNIFITIIDGQHRIRGVEVAIERLTSNIETLIKTLATSRNDELEAKLKYFRDRLNDLLNIELVVSFFIDKTLEYQAMIFSTINRTQKRVSQSLVYSLFGLDTDDTPQKTALQIVLRLNGHTKSPFYKRIKLYGGSYSKDNSPPLSQATMVRSIVNLICENLRESENDRYRKRKELLKRNVSSGRILPFRIFYANNEDDKISDIIFFFFKAVEAVFKNSSGRSYWDFPEDTKKPENIFHTTVGYETLLRILVEIIERYNIREATSLDTFKEYLERANHLPISDITRYSFNQRGKRILYLDMSLAIWPPDNASEDPREKELAELMRQN